LFISNQLILFIYRRYQDNPTPVQNEELYKNFGFRMENLQDGFVAKESVTAIQNAFGDDAKLWKGSFHNKSEKEKEIKDKELHELGLFV